MGSAVVALLLQLVQGATIAVEAGESLQAAIEKASPGDVLEVESGIYRENLNITKQLTLRGVDTGGGMPVVDAGGGRRCDNSLRRRHNP